MRWAEILVEGEPASEDAVVNILMDAGCAGTATHRFDGSLRIVAYLPADDRLEGRLCSIRDRVRLLPALGLPLRSDEIGVRWVAEEDWTTAYRAFFKPIRVGRIVVRPSWWAEDAPAEPDDLVLEIDPGMAFGTGHHETTRLCLTALQDRIAGGESVLDVGTGSGILAIAAARLGAREVVGIEIDPVAADIAAENARRNGLADVITVLKGDSPLIFDGTADIVLANIVPDVIIGMAPDLFTKLSPGGTLITSGIVAERAQDVVSALEALRLATVEVRREGDWVAFVSEKRP
ncbi:MAG: 50S ribosomal protein L11 methyltransferase [Armatimonadota bacterium]